MNISPIQNYRVYNKKSNNNPAFKALYFRNEEVKKRAQAAPLFPNTLKRPEFQEAARKFNVVVIDAPKDKPGEFYFRACTKIEEKKLENKGILRVLLGKGDKKEIVPAGMQAPILYNYGASWALHTVFKNSYYSESDKCDYMAYPLEHCKEVFDKLVFKNDKVKENFMNHNDMVDFMDHIHIKNAASKYHVLINDCDRTGIDYQVCSDLTTAKGNIEPAGFFTPEYKMSGYSSVHSLKDEMDLLVSLSGSEG